MYHLISRIKKRHQAYHRLFYAQEGRLLEAAKTVLDDLAMHSGAKGRSKGSIPTSFVAGDPCQTAFNEGKRYLFYYIMHYLNLTHHDLNAYIQEYDDDQQPALRTDD